MLLGSLPPFNLIAQTRSHTRQTQDPQDRVWTTAIARTVLASRFGRPPRITFLGVAASTILACGLA